jgi:hypothetical protein
MYAFVQNRPNILLIFVNNGTYDCSVVSVLLISFVFPVMVED